MLWGQKGTCFDMLTAQAVQILHGRRQCNSRVRGAAYEITNFVNGRFVGSEIGVREPKNLLHAYTVIANPPPHDWQVKLAAELSIETEFRFTSVITYTDKKYHLKEKTQFQTEAQTPNFDTSIALIIIINYGDVFSTAKFNISLDCHELARPEESFPLWWSGNNYVLHTCLDRSHKNIDESCKWA